MLESPRTLFAMHGVMIPPKANDSSLLAKAAAAGKAGSHTSTPCEVTLGTFPRASKHTQERTKRAVAAVAVVTMVAWSRVKGERQ
jgi:hypothetical protein